MIEKQDIRDEAKRRILDLVGGHRGADLALKTLLVVIRHLLSPNNQTRTQLHGVLSLVDCSNRLEKSLVDDYRDDRHWPIPETPVFHDRSTDELRQEVRHLRAMMQAMQDRVSPATPMQLVIQHQQPEPAVVETGVRELPSRISVVREPDLETAEREALAAIMASVNAASERLPVATAEAMATEAAAQSAAMRTAQTMAELQTIRDDVLAYIESVRAAA